MSESEQSNLASRLRHTDTPEATALSDEIRVTVNQAIEQYEAALELGLLLQRQFGQGERAAQHFNQVLGGGLRAGDTEAMFTHPQDQRTSDYVNGRFG